ncbi:protein kinase [Nocardia sp. NPDC048505]|uniref:serine/threonine-protein kinase n=1 Tax=unclassified Nocardia TaxID=2637762 RepID=UPI00340BBF89
MISGRTVVDGRFELIEPLGSGGMGTVWRALDNVLHREVALKEVRPDVSPGASSPAVQRERVLREARALARIGHPNVVAVHHIVNSEAETHPWIVMELVRGQSLADRLAAGPLPVGVAARLGRGILAGLRAAHAVGVLHRDVKPANVVLREDGSPVLTDFGIAAIEGLGGLTSTGHLVGSLEYVAPERLGGKEGYPASDLWSLGLVLYVAVEGFHPMRRETTVAVLAAVLAGEVPPPRRAGALTPVLEALLVADPERRPSTEDVDRLLAQAISATSTPSMPLITPPYPGTESTTRTSVTPAGAYRPQPFTPPPGALHQAAPQFTGPRPEYGPPPSQNFRPPGSGELPVDNPQRPSYSPGPRPLPRPPGRSRRLLILGGIAAIVIGSTGATVAFWPRTETATTSPPTVPGTAADPGAPDSRPPTATVPSAAPASDRPSLLTPAGIRQAIAALEKATGGQEFTEATVYPDYINTGAPKSGRPTVYDTYTYNREKAAITSTQPGGTITDPTIRLGAIDWDILPALLQLAQEKIGLAEPTRRYLIIDNWTFNDDKPTLRVYLSDEYGAGGYMAANLDGSFVDVVTAER